MRSFWRMIRLAVTVALIAACGASEFDMDFDTPYHGPSYSKPPQCVSIPDDLRLCHNVGYERMLLPNLLEHETLAEVKQQASSWVPLVHKKCHPSTQILLCSLFAPVCLDRPIYPCRLLCEAVRDGCAPIMLAFGFPWPDMLTCDKFPTGDMCISMNNATDVIRPTGNLWATVIPHQILRDSRACAWFLSFYFGVLVTRIFESHEHKSSNTTQICSICFYLPVRVSLGLHKSLFLWIKKYQSKGQSKGYSEGMVMIQYPSKSREAGNTYLPLLLNSNFNSRRKPTSEYNYLTEKTNSHHFCCCVKVDTHAVKWA